MPDPADPPMFPMARRCPFRPASGLAEVQDGERVRRVRIWNGRTAWLVTGYQEVRAVLTDPRISSDTDHPGFPHDSKGSATRRRQTKTFIHMDDPDHARLRRMATREFAVRRIEALRPTIQHLTDQLVDDMLAGPNPVDLVTALALPIPSLVICDLLGVPYEQRDLFHQNTRVNVSWKATAEQAQAAQEEMLAYLDSLIGHKSAAPSDDIISRLIEEQVRPGHLSREELVSMLEVLLVAGHETTANMIALSVLALLRQPDTLAELRDTDDPALVANAVEELLRWLTVAHKGRRRVALDDLEIAGQRIREGDAVIAALDIANHDSAAFENPDTLDVHRRARHHMAFGFGVHQCLGQPVARVELQVVLATIARRIPTLELAVDFSELRFKDASVAYGVDELPVTW